MSLVETGDSWVDANFKETDLTRMSVGQKATVTFDAYPGHAIDGVVDSIGAGTGAEFSVLPAQNATGNWVKVVQRVPVRIRLVDPPADVPLRTGLSASVEVDLKDGGTHVGFLGASPAKARTERAAMSAGGAAPAFVEVKHRGLITVSVMAAMIMQVLDTTIANVALPHMQSSLGAAQDTITWVLTSYIVAAAIATPITGWLSDNIGTQASVHDLRRRLRRRLGALRHGVQPRGDGPLPHPPGRLRRGAGAALAVGDHGHQPARAPGPGDGDLGRRHHGRADHRPDDRRLADRRLQLALGLLHQRAGRQPPLSPASTSSCPTRSAASASSISSASPCCRSPSARSSSCSTAASSSTGSSRPRS